MRSPRTATRSATRKATAMRSLCTAAGEQPPLTPTRELARDGVSREVPCSALKGETVPDSLPAYLGWGLQRAEGRAGLAWSSVSTCPQDPRSRGYSTDPCIHATPTLISPPQTLTGDSPSWGHQSEAKPSSSG